MPEKITINFGNTFGLIRGRSGGQLVENIGMFPKFQEGKVVERDRRRGGGCPRYEYDVWVRSHAREYGL